jgi:hypothetical protein
MDSHGGMILTREKQRTQRNTYVSTTFSTTNPTWTDQGLNIGLHGERPATNCFSHAMAGIVPYIRLFTF